MTNDPEQIRGTIERTQQNLSADVDALAEKVSPPRMVERRVRRTRAAMTGIKDKIMGTAAEQASAIGETASSSAASAKETLASKASSATDLASSAPEQVRQRAQGNPLAVGLIAFGAGWLVSSLLPASEREKDVASRMKDLAAEKGRPVAQQLGQAGQGAAEELRESARERAESVKQTATEAASAVTDETQSQASDVTGHAREARGRLSEKARSGGS